MSREEIEVLEKESALALAELRKLYRYAKRVEFILDGSDQRFVFYFAPTLSDAMVRGVGRYHLATRFKRPMVDFIFVGVSTIDL